jgi:hypothetical protein
LAGWNPDPGFRCQLRTLVVDRTIDQQNLDASRVGVYWQAIARSEPDHHDALVTIFMQFKNTLAATLRPNCIISGVDHELFEILGIELAELHE